MRCRLFFALFSLFAALGVVAHAEAPTDTPQVGFRKTITAEGVEVGIWFPAAGTPARQRLGLYSHEVVANATPLPGKYPLIVMSHGTGGSFSGHVDTAVALAKAGFVVAALTHLGDNWQDNSRATQIEDRPKALSQLITYMLNDAPERGVIDPQRIGAFGFSAGGFTVLAAAGGRPDFARLIPHCQAHPAYFDCQMIASHPRPTTAIPAPSMPSDTRLKALVVAAPALGFTFTEGLKDLSLPVQLWRADADEILPAPDYADAVRQALPQPAEFHAVPNAGHFDFLAPCVDVNLAPHICKSRAGFDRAAFHDAFNAEVVRFFSQSLR
ncbi:prolyl oligopeptidase family serine peptidase [Asticcacaulis sp.]|uniref:alpha/beta hydrolase family protein n=1 Tax=Asticcacaulis sp. TaxID=1872648 RepID=UPI0026184BCD|nr:prolyl oligopeptidase family serine peptidase [Asticcacaulis sp.]